MELGQGVMVMLLFAILLVGFLVFLGVRLKARKQGLPERKKLRYEEARELARTLLKKRYQGQRGFVTPYAREFDFKFSSATLRKVLQETNPLFNRHYLQIVLDDLATGQYEVLSPHSGSDDQAVA